MSLHTAKLRYRQPNCPEGPRLATESCSRRVAGMGANDMQRGGARLRARLRREAPLSDAQRRVEANQRAEGALPFDPSDEAEMRIEIDRITPDEIALFLTDNPMVADFEWYETLDKADECARDGNTHSVAHAFAEAHSTRRKAMYQDWVNTPRNTPGWQPWDEIWNATDVAMEILDEWRHRPAEVDTNSVYSLEEQDAAL